MLVPARAIHVNHFFEVDGVTYIKRADDPDTGEVLAQGMDEAFFSCDSERVVRVITQPEQPDASPEENSEKD